MPPCRLREHAPIKPQVTVPLERSGVCHFGVGQLGNYIPRVDVQHRQGADRHALDGKELAAAHGASQGLQALDLCGVQLPEGLHWIMICYG